MSPLKNPYHEKLVETGTTFELQPPSGDAYRVKDIQVIQNASASKFLTVKIGRKTVGYFRIGPTNRNHLGVPARGNYGKSILAFLMEKGLFRPYPVAEGEKFTLSGFLTTDVIKVVYEVWDAADVAKTESNGSESSELDYIAYGSNLSAQALQPAGYIALDKIVNPGEMAEFPFEGRVPAKYMCEVLGIGGMEYVKGAAGPVNTYTHHLRLIKEREVLFDEDKVGFLLKGDPADVADTEFGGKSQLPYHSPDQPGRLFLFPTPILIDGDEELKFELDYTWTGAGLAIGALALDVFAVLKLKPRV